ncbi:toprim domain-containing protein [Phenylobacterium sp. CCH9-H3]|uniref:toprim domain-containing protein n=1 Tax=Phenylobacterium sp. CCH9-H3 TaxID=1768774 RepID=UPI0009E882A8|nr:toprim domain-containing protein [Phenylobacterium sp. CCH9-H3]
MTLYAIAKAVGGDVYARGRRANIPAPGHSLADRSVSLLVADGRLVIHCFGAASWQEVRADLLARGLIDASGFLIAAGRSADGIAASPTPGRLERRAFAEALWLRSGELHAAGPAGRYCLARCAPEALGRPWALRSHAAAPVSVYGGSRFTRPALVCAVRSADDGLTAVELTYLTTAGARCTVVRTPRKAIGVLPPGSAVRLAPAEATLLVGEGVFTTLSAMAHFDLPGWALLSTRNLRRWTPPPGVRRVLIAADRGADGEASAATLRRVLAGLGVEAEIRCPPPPFGDWNDWRMAARDAERAGRRSKGRVGRARGQDDPRPGAGA